MRGKLIFPYLINSSTAILIGAFSAPDWTPFEECLYGVEISTALAAEHHSVSVGVQPIHSIVERPAKMAWRQKTLKLAEGDAHLRLRFLSALMHGWDRLPAATQGWIMRDAFVMQNGLAPSGPEVLLAFVNTYKGSEPASELAT
jgi:hypothetical protein